MRKINPFCSIVLCLCILFLFTAAARAQSDATVSPGTVRDEVRQLISDLNNPNYDYSKVPGRMREVFQDFRSATSSMDPGDAAQFRGDLMQQLMPVIMANQQKIQEAVRMEFLNSLQQPLGCSDDEFAAIKPYLEKVVDDWQAMQINRFRPPAPATANATPGAAPAPGATPAQNNPPRPPMGGNTSAVQQAAADLQQTLEDSSSTNDLIKNKLDTLRQAQDKAQQDLKVARSQLQELLTERQEGVLVEYGLLD
jgi:hypothetical protein